MNTRTPIDRIENELKKLFESLGSSSSTKVSFILSMLDLYGLDYDSSKNHIYLPVSLAKLYIHRRVKGITTYDSLIDSLGEEDIINLGFYKDKENKWLLPKKRTFNYFLNRNKEVIYRLDRIAERILSLATKNNIVLDIEVVRKVIKNLKEENSKKRLAVKEAIKLIKKLIYPQVDIKINHNARFTTKDLLDILVHVCYSHDFINNGCDTFAVENPNLETPNPDTILYHFKKLDSIDRIEEIFRNIFDFIFNFAKSNYKILNRRELDIAIDITKLPYYGKQLNPDYIKGGYEEGVGTKKFIHFITCSIVTPRMRFVIDAMPISALDSLEEPFERIIKRVKSKIKVRHSYLDRGFDRGEIINILKRNKINYIMPKIRSATVKAWFDKNEAREARVIKNFSIGKNTTTNLILVDDENGIKRAFSTNLDIPEQLAHYLFRFYSSRWGIETSYRQLDHDFMARTTSRNFTLRLFYFLFSTCLYNLWVLVNLCASLRIYGRLVEKPIITSKLFALILYKMKYEYIDLGG